MMFPCKGRRALQKCFKLLRLSFTNFSSLPDLDSLNVVRTVEKTIDNNTTIFIESPIHVKVQPIDVHNISAHNKLLMRLYSQGKDASDFQVQQSSKRLELFNKNIAADCNDVCLVEVPYQLKVHVTTTDNASVHMERLEGEEILVKTQGGSVIIKDIKAQNISVNSVKGELTSEGKLQASNIEFKTGLNASIKCENIRANNFVLTTHAGLVAIKSCHSDRSHITTAMGDMYLDHMHRSVLIDVIQQANLHINGFSGQLQASLKSGNVFMLAAQLTDKSSIFIHEKGKVQVLMPDIIKNLPEVNLIADKIQVEDKVLKLGRLMIDSHPKRFRFPAEGERENELYVVCKNGSIELKETDMPFIVKTV